jgi:outer membrane receptor for ferrienterochelin and colicins
MKILFLLLVSILLTTDAQAESRQARGTLIVQVRRGSEPVSQVEVIVGDLIELTNDAGEAVLQVPPGDVDVTVQRFGFARQELRASIQSGTTARLSVQLAAEVVRSEEVTVTATRTEQRIEDVPLRVEVLQQEEIEEKALMTPGDVAMLLNETSGLRVQVTSPSLGAANIRVQGLRGRYTQLLSDGLPLYGGQPGGTNLLQIPPLDLGQVEIIKGAASALYGSSALGGVINLISRRPDQSEHELLLNRTSRGGTDAVFWLAEPLLNRWHYTILGGIHHQRGQDIDRDGWADMPGYRRGTVRPRFSRDDGAGRSIFITAGAMLEDRKGGTIGNATVPDGTTFPENLRTRRFDTGVAGRFLVGKRVLSVRGSAMTQRHRHVFGPNTEHDGHHTLFGETSLSGASGAHTWVFGSALQSDLYRSRDVPRFDYTYTVPAIFMQDDYVVSPRLSLSGSGRVDFHSDYGSFFNPRLSALLRLPGNVTARLSTGTGVFAPTPFTEETEAVGLTNVLPLRNVKRERARSASADLGWTVAGLELNGSVFGSVIRDPLMLRLPATSDGSLEIVNAEGSARTIGTEFLARRRLGDFGITFTHTYLHSTEVDPNDTVRREVPLTPRHAVGLVGMWEKEGKGRIGIEVFYTGTQRLDDNPYRAKSRPYWIFGFLAERRFGPVRLFINTENLGNTRQTRYDKLVRPQRHTDGRWTVDAWAPLEGRTVNGGLRIGF